MLAAPAVMFLLASAASGTQMLEEDVSCTMRAFAESKRCLIQQQRAGTTAPQHVESVSSRKEKSNWTGEVVDVEFSKSAPDMAGMTIHPRNDFNNDYPDTSGNVTKYVMTISYAQTDGGQIVADVAKDVINMYGFTSKTSGLANSNANRIWAKHPTHPKARLIYAFTMTDVPGHSKWSYSVEFANTPPSCLKIFPSGDKVFQRNNINAIAMTCDNPDECGDGDFVVAAVIFTPITEADKKPMGAPEEAHKLMEKERQLLVAPNANTDSNRVPELMEKERELQVENWKEVPSEDEIAEIFSELLTMEE